MEAARVAACAHLAVQQQRGTEAAERRQAAAVARAEDAAATRLERELFTAREASERALQGEQDRCARACLEASRAAAAEAREEAAAAAAAAAAQVAAEHNTKRIAAVHQAKAEVE